jgi:integrase
VRRDAGGPAIPRDWENRRGIDAVVAGLQARGAELILTRFALVSSATMLIRLREIFEVRCARRAVPQLEASGRRVDHVFASGAWDAARPIEAPQRSRTEALTKATVLASFRPWHGMRHTAFTETAAAGVPGMLVQAKAGHTQGATTERYLHAARISYPDAAELAEARLFVMKEAMR